MRSFFLIFFCSIFCALSGQSLQPYNNAINPGIIPAPQHIEVSPKGGYTKFKKKISRLNPNLPAEGYKLIIEKKQITIEYADNNGWDNGNNTLLQIMDFYDDEKIPCMTITDHPRFRYRGIHLDVSRHFFDIGFLFKYAELASNYRFNVIHLHLTDDQGWRFESKLYPKLNTISSTRAGTQTGPYSLQHFDSIYYGGLYTQDQLTNFAKDCHDSWGITVIPEIEMPGHALAALAAYPELSCSGGPFEVAKGWGVFDDVFCAGNDATFTFLQ
ncbi:MAG: family 20 glycosylhydrolase, partial [Bacteroidia bacterium]